MRVKRGAKASKTGGQKNSIGFRAKRSKRGQIRVFFFFFSIIVESRCRELA